MAYIGTLETEMLHFSFSHSLRTLDSKLISIRLAGPVFWKYFRTLRHWFFSNLSVCRKIFWHCQFVQNLTPVDEEILKIQSDPSLLGSCIFFINVAGFLTNIHRISNVLFYIHNMNITNHRVHIEIHHRSWSCRVLNLGC